MGIEDYIDVGVKLRPPRIILYGTEGIGKSEFCARSKHKKPIYLNLEDGLDLIDCKDLKCKTLQDYQYFIDMLINEETDFDCVCIDTLDALERLIQKDICQRTNKATIMEIGFGKGIAEAASMMGTELLKLDALKHKGMTVVITAHSHVKRFDSPMHDAFDRYTLKMHEKSSAIAREWCDALLFVTYKVATKTDSEHFGKEIKKGIGKGERVVYTEERPAYDAKNRYKLPHKMDFSFDLILKTIKENFKNG